MSELGDCFHVALDNAQEFGWDVVHGTVVGTGGAVEGVRFAHAWNERGGFVFDESNGNSVCVERETYYRIGNVDDVTTYSPGEAMAAAVRAEHFGPWADLLVAV